MGDASFRRSADVSPRRPAGHTACKGCRNLLFIRNWNVEGLTNFKLHEIFTYMVDNSIDIMCLQETRKTMSDTYVTDLGYEVFLFGTGDTQRHFAGV